jgi:hypothetical protein
LRKAFFEIYYDQVFFPSSPSLCSQENNDSRGEAVSWTAFIIVCPNKSGREEERETTFDYRHKVAFKSDEILRDIVIPFRSPETHFMLLKEGSTGK